MSHIKSKFHFLKGVFWEVVNGKRVGIEDVGIALDRVTNSRCCGVDCCESVLYLRDQVTGNINKIGVSEGELVILEVKTPAGEVVPQT